MLRCVRQFYQLREPCNEYTQATVIQADAADDKAISGVCQQALSEEGRLDIFFANVRRQLSIFSLYAIWLLFSTQAGIATIRPLEMTPGEVFTNTMRVNALSYVPSFCVIGDRHELSR